MKKLLIALMIVGVWGTAVFGGECKQERKIVRVHAYQGYMPRSCYDTQVVGAMNILEGMGALPTYYEIDGCSNEITEARAILLAAGKNSQWRIDYVQWNGEPMRPGYYGQRYGFIIFSRCIKEVPND